MQAFPDSQSVFWKVSPWFWAGIAVCILLMAGTFDGIVASLLRTWGEKEEYSHGYFIPVISAYLIYQQRFKLRSIPFTGSWFGLAILAFGGLLSVFGRLAVISTMGQYALVICIWGLTLSFMGWRAFKVIWPALFMLVFMVKLPQFLYNNLSSELQLISSQVGVWFIRLFDISVFYEGNVIDLGSMKLQVVEACSGLRYLFPLMALSMILAIMYRGPLWSKALIFLSSMPVSILMNSFRIGAIGVTVEYWGQEMAEGVLHDFEGWVVFMGALIVIILEIKVLGIIRGDRRSLSEILWLEPETSADDELEKNEVKTNQAPLPLYLAIAMLIGIAVGNSTLSVAETVYPKRQPLSHFPLAIGQWIGKPSYIEAHFLQELKLDDYIIADYQKISSSAINFYVAHYNVQAEGEGTIHSPKSCLPGAGWRINSIEQVEVPGATVANQPLRVNRALISKGNNKMLVYYWLQGRGRIITDEFMAKWWIFWDRLTKGRSDGALVRVIVEVGQFDEIAEKERELQDFVQQAVPLLDVHVPN